MSDAASPVPHRSVLLRDALRVRDRIVDKRLEIVTLVDRRPSAPSAPREWLFQVDLEDLLYPSVVTIGTTGAFYRLLKRSAAGNGMAMPLRHTSISAGLVTETEFNALKALLSARVRVFTLVPIDAVEMALATYGRTPASVSLIDALGMAHPQSWEGDDEQPIEEAGEQGEVEGEEEEEVEEVEGEEEAEEEEAEEEEAGEEEAEEDKDKEEADDEEGASGSDNGGNTGVDDSDSASGSRSPSHHEPDDEYPPTEEERRTRQTWMRCPNTLVCRPSIEVSEALEKQFASFKRYRVLTVNRQRSGKAVATVTADEDRRSVLHFFAWLKRERGVAPSFGLFASPHLGAIAEQFIESKARSCSHARISKLLGSLVAASRFTHATLKAKATPGTVVDAQPVEELVALHAQCKGEALEEAKVAIAKAPKAWLTWEQCQQARLRSEQAVAFYEGANAREKLTLARVCCVLKLFTALPPDRVRGAQRGPPNPSPRLVSCALSDGLRLRPSTRSLPRATARRLAQEARRGRLPDRSWPWRPQDL